MEIVFDKENDLTDQIIIVGAGMVGMSLAIGLAKHQIPVSIIDEQPDYRRQANFFVDNRCSAVTAGSAIILKQFGVWEGMAAHVQAIREIRVSDQAGKPGRKSKFFLHFNADDLPVDTASSKQPLGYMVENEVLRRALFEKMFRSPSIQYYPGVKVVKVEQDQSLGQVKIFLSNATNVQGKLLIAADGRGSKVRNMADIPVIRWSYHQSSVIFNIHHELPHHSVAFEHFTPGGPLAILPMHSANEHRSAVVWTDNPAAAVHLYKQDNHLLAKLLEQHFSTTLGKIEIRGEKKIYPLSGLHAARYINQRIVLIGDAAHVIHPIAGQGFNLGIRDCGTLSQILQKIQSLGLDYGQIALLQEYEKRRRPDNLLLIAATDFLDRLFSNRSFLLRHTRDAGMGIIQRLPSLKEIFMKQAMGLLMGQPLHDL